MKSTLIEISIKQFLSNIKNIKQKLSKKTKIMLVVKADAYGHGAIELAKAAQKTNIDYFAVAWLSEAIELRKNGINTPILLLSEPINNCNEEVIKHKITQTIYTKKFADQLNKNAEEKNEKVTIHIKIDTGMSRLGCPSEQAIDLIHHIKSLKNIVLEGIYTHFSSANQTKSSFTTHQIPYEILRNMPSKSVPKVILN